MNDAEFTASAKRAKLLAKFEKSPVQITRIFKSRRSNIKEGTKQGAHQPRGGARPKAARRPRGNGNERGDEQPLCLAGLPTVVRSSPSLVPLGARRFVLAIVGFILVWG